MPTVQVHVLCYNEREILPYSLRHYATFADSIVVHDAFSTDGSREIARSYGADVQDWQTDGVNDLLAKQLKERSVMQCRDDWCITVDADELIYFPQGAAYTLESYDAQGVAVVRTRGFELFSDAFPTTEGQIYDEVKQGSPSQKWYGKAVLVAPKRIRSITFGAGAHNTWAKLKDGTAWNDVQEVTQPETYLLHAKHLGPIERDIARYDRQRSRLSQKNLQMGWGNLSPSRTHALEKRAEIAAGLRRIIE